VVEARPCRTWGHHSKSFCMAPSCVPLPDELHEAHPQHTQLGTVAHCHRSSSTGRGESPRMQSLSPLKHGVAKPTH